MPVAAQAAVPRSIAVPRRSGASQTGVRSLPARVALGVLSWALFAAFVHVLATVLRPHWPQLMAWFGSDKAAFVFGLTLVHGATYILAAAFFGAAYLTGAFEAWRVPGKVQPWSEIVRSGLLARSLASAVFNSICVSLPATFLTFDGTAASVTGAAEDFPAAPAGLTVGWQILVFMAVDGVVYYAGHRLLHGVPFLYRHVHKMHHEWHSNVAFASEHAHPLEALLLVGLSVTAGPALVGRLVAPVHIVTMWAWVALRTWEGMDAHSGFDLPVNPVRLTPWSASAASHELHHRVNTGNYGSFSRLWDIIFATEISSAARTGSEKGDE
jgi:sterol desaturase/sphingolipid hydroxylase (fatty acid hydroxylase superfamily)